MNRMLIIALGMGLFAGTAGGAWAATTLNGAEIYSNESVKYGRWEIRMQAAAMPGSVSAFFTFYNNSYLGSPEPWREIDIEILGKNGNGFQSNLITGNAASKTNSEAFHASASDLSKGFHTYVLDWTPDSIVYRFDGKTVRKNPGAEPQVKDLSGLAQSYRMNLWASTAASWAGTLDPDRLPIAQTVNWIAYSSYTPGQGPDGSDFTPQWTDDFNTLNRQRWSLGTWTFDGNMADFTQDNALVSGGYLTLILSKKGWKGTVNPPSDSEGNTRKGRSGGKAKGSRSE
jgi:endo-1,3-1,4-beta-glycanase ExoK